MIRHARLGVLALLARVVCVLAVSLAAMAPAHADAPICRTPAEFALTGLSLPASKARIAGHKQLVILVLGGASTTGIAAGGRAYSIPARLDARLHELLPGIDLAVVNRSLAGQTIKAMLRNLNAELAETDATLVLWDAGSMEAAAGDGVDDFTVHLQKAIEVVQAARRDMILMDLQYGPSIARIVNQTPYRRAIQGAADMADITMMHRYDLMQAWSDDGSLDLDTAAPGDRVKVARALYDCLASVLADGIAGALR